MAVSLFTPGKIGAVQLKNRFTVPAMLTGYAEADGTLNERFIRYYEERAAGGFALIVVEDTNVLRSGAGFANMAGLWDDAQVPGHKTLVKRIHQHDCRIFVQLYHAGRQAPRLVSSVQCVAPSPIPDPVIRELPHELTLDEIKELERAFVAAAIRAEKAGYDGVELHAAHGYLINEFLSPFSNRRTDLYGGTLENRLRFLLKILHGIRRKTGKNFAVTCKLSVDEFVEGGLELHESQRIAQILEAEGIDAITASGGVYKTGYRISAPYYCASGCFAHLARGLKAAVKIPVIAINRINTPLVAHNLVAEGSADFVALGRASIADPDFPEKTRKRRYQEILPCIACDQGCQGNLANGRPVACLVNPRTGYESEANFRRVKKPRQLIVAGGGLAGMSAALTAAQRGHKVQLFEASDRLGGLWNQAAMPPCKEIFNSLTVYLERQLAEAGVIVHLHAPLTPERLDAEKVDLLWCATGSTPRQLPIPGLATHPNVVTAIDLLSGNIPYGQTIAILGGGMVGAETAEHLALHGSQVTLIARSGIAKDMVSMPRHYLLRGLRRNGVQVFDFCDIESITPDGVNFIRRETQAHHFASAAQIVLALGAEPNRALVKWAEQHAIPYRLLGDADHVADGLKAMRDGYQAALSFE